MISTMMVSEHEHASGKRITDAGSSERFIWRLEACNQNGCEWHSSWDALLADSLCYPSFVVRLASCLRADCRYDILAVKTRGACHTTIPSLAVRLYSRLRFGSSYCLGSFYLFDGWSSSMSIGTVRSRTGSCYRERSSRGFYSFPGTQRLLILVPPDSFLANLSRCLA
jgi:hypothetical protein